LKTLSSTSKHGLMSTMRFSRLELKSKGMAKQ
jgi:hypothetical protein